MDFEKYWGVHDVMPISEVSHFKHVETVVSEILKLFNRYDIHASWATVGLLSYTNIASLQETAPKNQIPYTNQKFSPFPLNNEKYGGFDTSLLLGISEIKSILKKPNQELASHTYSHFYCGEEGTTEKDFEEDCQAMDALSKAQNITFKSIIFPRNQVTISCLKVCQKHGYTAFRGNQENRFWKNSTFESESFLKKSGRVLDAYFKISKTKTYSVEELKKESGILNIPANRFFRPASERKGMEKRKIRRIKNEMFKAAKNGTIYHLWWHPHNFSQLIDIHLKQLEELLAYYQVLNQKFEFRSMNMSEISHHVQK